MCSSCSKSPDVLDANLTPPTDLTPASPTGASFTNYTLKKGAHFADFNTYQTVNYAEQTFIVVFDSSAIYKTTDPANQDDVNKLYGFADNDTSHHAFSARFGWNWLNNALWLYAYVYNDGILQPIELTTIPLNQEVKCSIKVNASNYVFTVNGNSVAVLRTSKTPTGKGYRLYPYFGGDETAPHDIKIKIKEL
jgi:hypothetical protein